MTDIAGQIAKHLREVYFGGNWTAVNFKDSLKDVTWQQATTKVYSFNTIATLVFHTNYYMEAVTRVFKGKPIDSKDEYSFIHPSITSEDEWKQLLDKTYAEVENFACMIDQLPESKLWETFVDEKYGNYYRNLHGIIEHCHYHLGQIVLIKRMVQNGG